MLLPNRHGSSESYRYGFNGKEKDDEIKGEGVSYDLGARMLDPRTGRFFTVDPWASKYSWQSPYAYFSNNLIAKVDWNGLGDYYDQNGKLLGSDKKTKTIGEGENKRVVSDDKAYITSQAIIDQYTVEGKTDWDKVIEASGTVTLDIANSILNQFANTVAQESSGNKNESFALASAIINLKNYKKKSLEATMKTEGIYGYRDGGNSTLYNNNAEQGMAAAINALTGGFDHSYGAIRWDGFDLAPRGFSHPKPKDAGIIISESHFNSYKNAWPDDLISRYSGGTYSSFSSNFKPGIHRATSGSNKGKVLYKSTVVHGKTIFWGMNSKDFLMQVKEVGEGTSVSPFSEGASFNFIYSFEKTISPNKGFKGNY